MSEILIGALLAAVIISSLSLIGILGFLINDKLIVRLQYRWLTIKICSWCTRIRRKICCCKNQLHSYLLAAS